MLRFIVTYSLRQGRRLYAERKHGLSSSIAPNTPHGDAGQLHGDSLLAGPALLLLVFLFSADNRVLRRSGIGGARLYTWRGPGRETPISVEDLRGMVRKLRPGIIGTSVLRTCWQQGQSAFDQLVTLLRSRRPILLKIVPAELSP